MAFCALALLGAGAGASHLTERQMHEIAIAGVRATAPRALSYRSFGFNRSKDRGYEYFDAMVDEGQGHVGFFVVDPRTGDMWDGVSECGKITSPEIRQLQKRFRKKLGLSVARYTQIKRRGPLCDELPN
jgi:hypothetical protein